MPKTTHLLPHYKNLDGLRCLGSLVIVLGHCELFKSHFGVANFSGVFLHPKTGSSTVSLFFVLSGFLITALLLEEKKNTGTFSLRNFYLRRIFRLWPLYFIYIGFFYLLMPYLFIPHPPSRGGCEPTFDQTYLFLLLQLSNFGVFLPRVLGLGHLWSIGVEEQFYLMWPLVVRFSKNLLRTVLIIVAVLTIGKLIFSAWLHFANKNPVSCTLIQIRSFLGATRYECIALGGAAAVIYLQYPKWYSFLTKKNVQLVSLFLLIPCLVLSIKTSYIDQVLICIPFAILVLNMATNPASIIKTDHPVMNRLGKLSYGMYVWHPLVILLIMNLLVTCFGTQWSIAVQALYYVGVFISTLLVSVLSYQLIEKPFLRLRPYSVNR